MRGPVALPGESHSLSSRSASFEVSILCFLIKILRVISLPCWLWYVSMCEPQVWMVCIYNIIWHAKSLILQLKVNVSRISLAAGGWFDYYFCLSHPSTLFFIYNLHSLLLNLTISSLSLPIIKPLKREELNPFPVFFFCYSFILLFGSERVFRQLQLES